MIEGERDDWILIAAHSPERIPEFMADKRRQIEDPAVLGLYLTLDDAIDWDPDDPRLPGLADRLAAAIEQAMASSDFPDEHLADGTVELVDSMFIENVPAARRLLELLKERGWSGWTEMKPTTG